MFFGPPVSHDLHPSNHLANGEETQNFRSYYTGGSKLPRIKISYTYENAAGSSGAGGRSLIE